MTEVRKVLTCIRCPRGCQVEVVLANGAVATVQGNSCKRGELYVRSEVENPIRTVTTTVPVDGSDVSAMISVKTVPEVPKDKVFDVMDAVFTIRAKAPVSIGDVICHDIAGTGSDLVATRSA